MTVATLVEPNVASVGDSVTIDGDVFTVKMAHDEMGDCDFCYRRIDEGDDVFVALHSTVAACRACAEESFR